MPRYPVPGLFIAANAQPLTKETVAGMIANAGPQALTTLANAVRGSKDPEFRFVWPSQAQIQMAFSNYITNLLEDREWRATVDLMRRPEIFVELRRSLHGRYQLAESSIAAAASQNLPSTTKFTLLLVAIVDMGGDPDAEDSSESSDE